MSKPKKSILTIQSRYAYNIKVFRHGMDVTPQFINPMNYKGAKEKQIQEVQHTTTMGIFNQSGYSRIFHSESMVKGPMDAMNATITRRADSYYTTILSTEIADEAIHSTESLSAKTSAIYGLAEREPPPMPPYISLVLHETGTEIILDIPSSTVPKDSPEGALADADNKTYEYITVGKGKNRKVLNAEVQTVTKLVKTRETDAKRGKRRDQHSFASLWDMFDTFEETNKTHAQATLAPSVESLDINASKEEKQWLALLKNEQFLESICLMQRILSNNIFKEEQKRIRGMRDPSFFREDIEFKYTLNLLWTFANEETKGRCVTSLKWNPKNKDILAVAYGKFYYDDLATGLVLIWSIKNNVQPEREYNFPIPVTSCDFSSQNPNLLAIGFYDGDVKVIDISCRNVRFIGICDKQSCQLFEPIWQVCWYTDFDYYKGQEFLVATCQDGRIYKFRINLQDVRMTDSRMMHVSIAEGKLKGIETLRKCTTKNIPLAGHTPALLYTPHPADPNIYYIGTGEGVVHKCSKNYFHQHMDLFRAHDSPMYSMVFSPFCTKLCLTCGDDWAIRLWAENICEPLFEIKKKMAGVQGVAWCPSHSTIIASISGNEIYIWDLQRKTYDSQSTTISPTKSRNTLIEFTHDGRCLLVADIDGNVHVFALDDMPFPAFFQENLLTQSIKRSLITRPDLLNRIEKLGSLSHSKVHRSF